MLILLFLSSGLFLGWSLGANDASSIFGTAVATKMVKFYTAAIVASIFVLMGAVVSGAGTTKTLGALGSVDMIAGAFMVALAAAVTIFWMNRMGLPVSTSQAIVGAIIGWNLFAGKTTDLNMLTRIASAWIISPLLAALFSFILFFIFKRMMTAWKIHIFRLDAYTRIGLIVVGAFGAYSLGANNIANVMGVFVSVMPFDTLNFWALSITGIQQLFFLGGLAIAAGIFTYSKRLMMMVGAGVVKLTPQSALIVVFSQSLVLFLFSSKLLEAWLISHHMPTFPLVPVSSSQAVVGSILGIGLAHGGRNIRLKRLGRIASGWVTTPILAAIISFISLFFLQNVFDQQVVKRDNQLSTESRYDINSTLNRETLLQH